MHYVRRSTTIPESPTEVKFHPSSVDNLLVSQLLQASKAQDLASFLVRDLQGTMRVLHASCGNELNLV